MSRIRLLHWRAAEAASHQEKLRRAGYRVEYQEKFEPASMRSWREQPPDAFVIDLSRLPSHGREIAIALRQSPATRQIPVVFVDGAGEKVEQVRNALPDAFYCTGERLCSTLKHALANPSRNPVKPAPMMERYSARTAAQKLGIKESSTLALIDPPRDVGNVLDELPRDVALLDGNPENAAVILCFVHEVSSMRARLSSVRDLAAQSKLWVLWRKGGSTARRELNEALIRETAITLGLVDYKICSVNEVWSGMLFAIRRL